MTVTDRNADTVTDEPAETNAGAPVAADAEVGDDRAEVVDDVLVEEISIDGMCGVY